MRSGTAPNLLFYIGIILTLGLVSILSLGFSILLSASTYGKPGATGPQGPQGPQGVCLLNETNQTFISGNLTVQQFLIIPLNASIIFPNSSLTPTNTCLELNSTVPLCLNVPSIESSTNKTIFNNVTICFDPNCTIGIGPIQIGNTTFLDIFGEILLQNITLPFLIGNDGGYLDQLPGSGGGFLLASNPNSTGGIQINSRGFGIFGNETFNELITFLKFITANGGLRMYNASGALVFNLFYGPYLGLTGNSTESFIIQSNQSALILESLTNEVNISSPTEISLLTQKIFLSPNSYLFNSNLSFNLLSSSNQIGFFNGTPSSSLIGWIRSNNTCPISIGPLLCVQNENVAGSLTILSTGTLYFNTGAQLIANGTLNISAPNVFINSLTTNTFTVLGFTVFPAGISAKVVLSTGSLPNNFFGPINAPTIVAGVQLSSGGTLSVTGSSTLQGPTILANNVTFSGPFVKCTTPLFQAGVPNACIPDCIDFYNCSLLRSVGYYGRNFLQVATQSINISGVSSVFVQMGSNIDFITTNTSTLPTIKLNAINSTTKTGQFSQWISLDYNSMIGFNRSSISTIRNDNNPPVFTPSSCLPLITVINNQTGTPTPVTLSPPFYNYSNSSCTSIVETYDYSNTTTYKDASFMGSAVVTRTCTGGSNAVCTPFFSLATRNFPFAELLKQKTLTFSNDTIDSDTRAALNTLIFNLTIIFPNLTLQSLLDLFLINTTIITQTDTFTLASYAYVNASGEKGQVNISGSNGIFIGDASNQNVTISGDILGSDGNTHSCCGTSVAAVLKKFKRLTLTSPLTITGAINSSSIAIMNFATSSSTPGTLTGTTASTSTFTSPQDGIYSFSASLLISANVNVTSIGCLYDVQDASFSHLYYKFGSVFGTFAGLPSSDGTDKYLECSEFSLYLAQNDNVQFKIFTQNPLTTIQPTSYSVTLDTSSFIQINLT